MTEFAGKPSLLNIAQHFGVQTRGSSFHSHQLLNLKVICIFNINKLPIVAAFEILPKMMKTESSLTPIHPAPDWQNEMRLAIRNVKQLIDELSSHSHEFNFYLRDLNLLQNDKTQNYPIFIPRSLFRKIISAGTESALFKQFLPTITEVDRQTQQRGFIDPIGDENYRVTRHLIHRYQNRALFLPTNICPTICRYCFRKNELYDGSWGMVDLNETKRYLLAHPEVNEIIFTGGDPFSLSNEKLNKYLSFFSEIETIRFIRFHTRFPVIIPSRIDDELCHILQKAKDHFYEVTVAIHTNHVTEFDLEVEKAVSKLKKSQVQLLAQTVLLKDVNANVKELLDLFNKMIQFGIRPYYLHHPDQVKGAMHFRLPMIEGRKIYQQLRNQLPGWAIPQYVIDLPQGEGKTPAYNPENLEFSGQLINRSGSMTHYQDESASSLDMLSVKININS